MRVADAVGVANLLLLRVSRAFSVLLVMMLALSIAVATILSLVVLLQGQRHSCLSDSHPYIQRQLALLE